MNKKEEKKKENIRINIEQEFKDAIYLGLTQSFHELANLKKEDIQTNKPKDPSHGDIATNAAYKLASILGKSPNEIANTTASSPAVLEFKEKTGASVLVVDGWQSSKYSDDEFQFVLKEVLEQKENYGKGNIQKKRTILIEHTSPNPTKAFHLGHLKNNVTGLSISYLYEWQGAKVYRDMIDNNRGIAIARVMWGYLKFARKSESTPIDLDYWFDHRDEWKTPEEEGVDSGMFVDKLYTLASEDFKNPEVEERVRQLVLDWEAEDPKNWELWSLTQKWVWDGYKKVMTRINGWKFDHIWHEHEIYKKGKEHVDRGIKEGIFKVLEDGAVLTDFNKAHGITDTILRKNDGTSLYITQDLELSYLKKQKFHADEMIWVIGPEQSMAMKQMFMACSQLGFAKYEDFHHIPYGFVLVEGVDKSAKKMSSRAGTQVYVDELIDKAKDAISKLVTNEELTPEEKEEMSEKVAIGAIKYSLLKVGRMQDMVFSFENTISLEGDSGPYILYTYARARSILRKESIELDNINTTLLIEEAEIDILKKIRDFSSTTEAALRDYAPNYIATYVYELSQTFNNFYGNISIQKTEDVELKKARLALVEATTQVLKNGLNLLGIDTVEKM